jgi:DNA-binding transcriptional ArsR family regulator
MSRDAIELLLHPVRLRIVNAMSGGWTRTTSELCARMPDVSQATVYRHVGVLADEGVLEVEGEEQVRGAIERRYRLRRERAVIPAEQAASMSLADHRRGFTAAMAVLLAEFNSYLDRGDVDPFTDGVSYKQFVLWLNEAELADLIKQVRCVLLALMGNTVSSDRTPYLVSTILFPSEQRAPDSPAK